MGLVSCKEGLSNICTDENDEWLISVCATCWCCSCHYFNCLDEPCYDCIHDPKISTKISYGTFN